MAKATFRIICRGCTSAAAIKYFLPQHTNYNYACTDYRTPEKQVRMTSSSNNASTAQSYISDQDLSPSLECPTATRLPEGSPNHYIEHCLIEC